MRDAPTCITCPALASIVSIHRSAIADLQQRSPLPACLRSQSHDRHGGRPLQRELLLFSRGFAGVAQEPAAVGHTSSPNSASRSLDRCGLELPARTEVTRLRVFRAKRAARTSIRASQSDGCWMPYDCVTGMEAIYLQVIEHGPVLISKVSSRTTTLQLHTPARGRRRKLHM